MHELLIWNDNQISVIYHMIYTNYKCLDGDVKRFLAVVAAIAVPAAVTVPVLLVVGSVLSTQNG